PDAEAGTLQAAISDLRAMRSTLDEQAGVHVGEVAPPIEQRAALDRHVGRADAQRIAFALRLENGTWLAAQVHRFVDAELPGVLAGRQSPANLSLGLRRQSGDRWRRRLGHATREKKNAECPRGEHVGSLGSEHDSYLIRRPGRLRVFQGAGMPAGANTRDSFA